MGVELLDEALDGVVGVLTAGDAARWGGIRYSAGQFGDD
jgi:hypothetical protein